LRVRIVILRRKVRSMKKNLRKIPDEIITKLKAIQADEVVVACAVKFKGAALTAGRLKHLGVVVTEQGLRVPQSVLPPPSQGKFSKQNIDGEEIVRRDLPKETHYNPVESPDWGDWSNGTHTVYLPYEKYPREFRPPREIEIVMSCADSRPNLPAYVLAFRVEEVLNKKRKDFDERLFEDLNLLQENVGACGVEPAGTSLDTYAKSLHVSWEILPPGTRDEAIDHLFRGRSPSQEERKVAAERYDFFMSLKPKRLVYGSSGFRRYFGALLEDDLVVFENIEYGNAVYVLFENWEDLSKKSRVDLLSGKYGKDFARVIHGRRWKEQVRSIVADRRGKKK
jgi:hypothetical protein